MFICRCLTVFRDIKSSGGWWCTHWWAPPNRELVVCCFSNRMGTVLLFGASCHMAVMPSWLPGFQACLSSSIPPFKHKPAPCPGCRFSLPQLPDPTCWATIFRFRFKLYCTSIHYISGFLLHVLFHETFSVVPSCHINWCTVFTVFPDDIRLCPLEKLGW